MTFLVLILLVAFAAATALVLADSGLRFLSAVRGIAVSREIIGDRPGAVCARRAVSNARVTTTVSYAPAPWLTLWAGTRRAAA